MDTSFLPDKERDAIEKAERIKLKREWLAEQAEIKGNPLFVQDLKRMLFICQI